MSKSTDDRVALNAQEFLAPALGFAIFQISATTARLGIPDLLGEGGRTAAELAAECGTHEQSLFRLLRAAAAVGLLEMSDDGRFSLTTLGSMFRTDSPTRATDAVTLNSSAPVWQAWGGLADAVRTGDPAFDCAHGMGIFDYLERDPQLAKEFHAAMASGTESQIPLLVPHYDFGDAKHLIDIGGGDGTHLAAILNTDPTLRGTVFDTASGLLKAPSVLAKAGVADRCETVVGDFFAEVPSGGDVYLIKNTLTDWNDESSIKILSTCRRAMRPDSRIMVIATLMPEDIATQQADDVLAAAIFDISLMVLTTGEERTLRQYERLFTASGLKLGKVTPITRTTSQHTMLYHAVEALPA
ncbi:MAG TPA: methyltransferase [Pseudonocardiaceae bacterium]|jgi:hypothetical protein